MFRKSLFLSVVVVMMLSLSACGPKEVTFLDSNLEAAIREAIDKPEGTVLPSDLEGLTSLEASGRDITNLLGLEHCTNLAQLHLYNNQISDISPLSNLTNLEELGLDNNQISDISPLVENSGLSEEDSVNLMGNPLNTTSVNVYIPQLEERGVDLRW